MVEIKIDTANKAPMELTLSGSSVECAKEVSIMLVEVCKAISRDTGNTFDEVFTGIVGGAKLLHFFKDKENKNEH